MKEKTLIEILVVCLIVSVICNIIGVGILAERLAFNQKQEEMEQMNKDYWDEWAKQQSYDRAFSEWGEFECTFNNETLILETESGGNGDITITIFSEPVVNISLGSFDRHKTSQRWELKDNNISIKDVDENEYVIPKEWMFKEGILQFFELPTTVPSWSFSAPSGTWTSSTIDIMDNASTTLHIVVMKDIFPFRHEPESLTYNFQPIFCVFEVKI